LRLLLDTHTLLWFVAGDSKRIGPTLRARIEAGPATLSTASLWEIAIKSALGKLDAPEDLPEQVQQLGFDVLPVSAEHAWAVRKLPPRHRDPFDRLLVAQAQVEQLPIVTADPSFDKYDVEVVWS
jgi:PIN domain nuclease of toxin-antitoxin system